MVCRKKIVVVMVRYYLPGDKSGGPVRSVANLVATFGDEYDFRIVTSDRDWLDEDPYPGVMIDSWNQVGKAKVYYASSGALSMRALCRLLSNISYDLLYLNSFFDPVFSQRPLWGRRLGFLPAKPILIAPRGEFSQGALLLKRWKKAPYRFFASAMRLYKGLVWHASSSDEARDIATVIHKNRQIVIAIVIASDLAMETKVLAEVERPVCRTRDEGLRIVFVSRVTPMKNLDFALRVLAKVRVRVHFSIYGPIGEDNYWRECKSLMGKLPPNVSVEYGGVLKHSEVFGALGSNDLFFLPTRGENFGHVIMESLVVGTPVLIADTTPWHDLELAGVGWALPLDDEQAFANRIYDAAQVSGESYGRWRARVRSYGHERMLDSNGIVANRRLLMLSLGDA